MYTLMLVEDEPIVLEGMLKIIDFKALGFEVVCSCQNGLEAVEYYKKYLPDVVITDICMDYMDGLEFIESVKGIKEHTRFIVVSGHESFKFVKKALSLKVADYILKPVTAKEFREILTKIAKELNGDKENSHPSNEQNDIEKMVFLNKLTHQKLCFEEIMKNCKRYDISLKGPNYIINIFSVKELSYLREINHMTSTDQLFTKLVYEVKNEKIEEGYPIAFPDFQGNIIALLSFKDKQSVVDWVQVVYHKLVDLFCKGNKDLINCYLGLSVESENQIRESFSSADRLNVCGVLQNEEGWYDSEKILFTRANRIYENDEAMKKWAQSIIFGEKKAVTLLEEMLNNFKEACYLLTDFRIAANKMLEYLKNELGLISDKYLAEDYFKCCDDASEKEIKQLLFDVTTKMIDIIKGNDEKDLYIAQKGVQFIKANYSDSDLDLQQVCSELNISVSYFTMIFKKHTKMTFVKYLNTYRIEKAQYFLEHTKKSISEISEFVGFMDSHYFGIVFKKYTGKTPRKYRTMVAV